MLLALWLAIGVLFVFFKSPWAVRATSIGQSNIVLIWVYECVPNPLESVSRVRVFDANQQQPSHATFVWCACIIIIQKCFQRIEV